MTTAQPEWPGFSWDLLDPIKALIGYTTPQPREEGDSDEQ